MTPDPEARPEADLVVVGAGAAGLMAAIAAGRAAREAGAPLRIVVVDGARTLGAKILVAGGGRCNVTHDVVDETAFAGSSRKAIRKVLLRFDVARTREFFAGLGVELKREETGKLFPVTDRARTVLDALLRAAADAGAVLRHPWRAVGVERTDSGFLLTRGQGSAKSPPVGPPGLRGRRVILATGGRSLPRSGSDGGGYSLARSLGHTLTPRIFPGLVPLLLPPEHFLCALTGVSAEAALELRASGGKRLQRFVDSILCTHFGLSGPGVLDMSRYYLDAAAGDPGAHLVVSWLPDLAPDGVDAALRGLGTRSVGRWVGARLPDRLSRALCERAGVEPAVPGHSLTRDGRRALVAALTALPLPVTGDRGYNHAEVTAGGVPLSELRLETMESRPAPGAHLCGEILDVDGRIGGFNFQWAWAGGHVAGTAAVRALLDAGG